jgi:hypothetical protein
MLGIIVHQKLTGLAKTFVACVAMVRKIGCSILWYRAVGQHRVARQEGLHATFPLGILVYGIASILGAFTATAKAAFHMLHSVGARAEARFLANRTSHRTGTMDLHVHVQLVLVVKAALTLTATKRRTEANSIDTIDAAIVPVGLAQLSATKAFVGEPLATVATITSHPAYFFLSLVEI